MGTSPDRVSQNSDLTSKNWTSSRLGSSVSHRGDGQTRRPRRGDGGGGSEPGQVVEERFRHQSEEPPSPGESVQLHPQRRRPFRRSTAPAEPRRRRRRTSLGAEGDADSPVASACPPREPIAATGTDRKAVRRTRRRGRARRMCRPYRSTTPALATAWQYDQLSGARSGVGAIHPIWARTSAPAAATISVRVNHRSE